MIADAHGEIGRFARAVRVMIDLRRGDGDDNRREGAIGAVMFGVALDCCAEGVFEHFGEDIL